MLTHILLLLIWFTYYLLHIGTIMINLILDNWDTIALVITNVLAYFAKSPRQL